MKGKLIQLTDNKKIHKLTPQDLQALRNGSARIRFIELSGVNSPAGLQLYLSINGNVKGLFGYDHRMEFRFENGCYLLDMNECGFEIANVFSEDNVFFQVEFPGTFTLDIWYTTEEQLTFNVSVS